MIWNVYQQLMPLPTGKVDGVIQYRAHLWKRGQVEADEDTAMSEARKAFPLLMAPVIEENRTLTVSGTPQQKAIRC